MGETLQALLTFSTTGAKRLFTVEKIISDKERQLGCSISFKY
jgi:hypothetical protein